MSVKKDGRSRRVSILAIAAWIVMCSSVSAAGRDCRIAVVKSKEIQPYNVALEGFFEVLNKQRFKCETVTYTFRGMTDGPEEIKAKIRAFRPDLVLTIGTRATSVMSKSFDDTPVVFAMVLYPVASAFVATIEKPGKNLTGAALDVPIERQLHTLARIVPDLKRVGVLYSPEETLPIIEAAKRVADSMGIELLAETVGSESDVPSALNRLEKRRMEALWSVADDRVFTFPSTEYIGKYVVRRGIPFMGPSSGFVKNAGALVALTANYQDNGRQAGEIAVQILGGKKPENIAVATPRMVEMALNLQVANHIRLRVPKTIVDEASQVFE